MLATKIIAPDSRGHGGTNNPSGEFSYDLKCEDIVSLIECLGLERPFVCGWSDGGHIALEIGIRYPKLVNAIVAGGVLAEVPDCYYDTLNSIGISGPGDFDLEKFKESYSELQEALSEIHSPVNGPEYWRDLLVDISRMWMNPKEFPRDRRKRITTPTLVLQADRDEAISLEEAILPIVAFPVLSWLLSLGQTMEGSYRNQRYSVL